MNKKAIKEKLLALAADDNKRSKTARLRDVIDDVEAALSAGVSHRLVVEALAENGLEMTLGTFETTLKRIRKKQTRPSPSIKSNIQSTTTEAPIRDNETKIPAAASHNPADLDKIIGSKPDLAALAKLAKRKSR